MKVRYILLLSFCVALLVWLCFSWPLFKYSNIAVPSLANSSGVHIEEAQPGDYLQLMYYCWLFGDFIFGKTPFFENIYEFNTGNDTELLQPDTYYFPFSVLFSLLSLFLGKALSWNITAIVSLWLTVFFSWLLARRYSAGDDWVAGLCAVMSILVPYRWVNLFGGSPAGWAFCWVPMIMLGVDIAIREISTKGGVIAALGFIFAAWGDQHVFFFSVLFFPLWIFVVLINAGVLNKLSFNFIKRLIKVLIIPVFAIVFALVLPRMLRLVASLIVGIEPVEYLITARSYAEVTNYSPEWRGYFGGGSLPINYQIYIGFMFLVWLCVGFVLLFIKVLKVKSEINSFSSYLFILLIILIIMLLAPGTRGPFKGFFMNLARELIPFYSLIRQPAKILCLFPTFLTIASAISFSNILSFVNINSKLFNFYKLLPLFAVVYLFADYKSKIYPTISILPSKSLAYERIIEDASTSFLVPHSLVIPLWPGDSHYSSMYQYFSSIYRVKMLNGYNPFIKKGYFENVFRTFESANQGLLSSNQIFSLDGIGVNYIIFYERLFPDKVSPFPASYTLCNLKSNPYLKFLGCDNGIYAFRMYTNVINSVRVSLPMYTPARIWEAEKISKAKILIKDTKCSGNSFASLAKGDFYLRTPYQRFSMDTNIYWAIRIKGYAKVMVEEIINDITIFNCDLVVSNDFWSYVKIKPKNMEEFLPRALNIKVLDGELDVDFVSLRNDIFEEVEIASSITIPSASLLYSSKGTIIDDNFIVFTPELGPDHFAARGPYIPFKKGRYKLDIDFAIDEIKPDREYPVAEIYLPTQPAISIATNILLKNVFPKSVVLDIEENTPLEFYLRYYASSKLVLKNISFTLQTE